LQDYISFGIPFVANHLKRLNVHKNHIKPDLLTDDNKQVAEIVSKKLGIDNYLQRSFLTKN